MPETDLKLIATTTMGFEAVVSRELEALGFEPQNVEVGRTLFHGDESAICRANLWLRTAGRVLLQIGEFEAKDFGQLFDKTYALPWERWIPPDGAFPVKGRSVKSQLSNVPTCQKMVKKAVVEKLKAAHGVRRLPERGAEIPIEVALLKDKVTLVLDTSGRGLHRRGYRTFTGPAPLRETLAAGLVLLSYWNPDRVLVDPFCGTGTIAIEAALIGRKIAPGLFRRFAAESWPTISKKLWIEARKEAKDLIVPSLPQRILASDIDSESLSFARHHAVKANVNKDIIFGRRSFAEFQAKADYGCMITNPPYAERMGAEREVKLLYASMPDVFQKHKTWSFYVYTAYPDFQRIIGKKADRRRKLYNGRIECTYYQYSGPRPPV